MCITIINSIMFVSHYNSLHDICVPLYSNSMISVFLIVCQDWIVSNYSSIKGTPQVFWEPEDIITFWWYFSVNIPVCPTSFHHRHPLGRPWKMLQKHTNRQKHRPNSLSFLLVCVGFHVQMLHHLCSTVHTLETNKANKTVWFCLMTFSEFFFNICGVHCSNSNTWFKYISSHLLSYDIVKEGHCL